MKTRTGFISNSSSTSFIIETWKEIKLRCDQIKNKRIERRALIDSTIGKIKLGKSLVRISNLKEHYVDNDTAAWVEFMTMTCPNCGEEVDIHKNTSTKTEFETDPTILTITISCEYCDAHFTLRKKDIPKNKNKRINISNCRYWMRTE